MHPVLITDNQVVPIVHANFEPLAYASTVPELPSRPSSTHRKANSTGLPPPVSPLLAPTVTCRHLSDYWFPHAPNAVGTYGHVFFALDMSHPQWLPVAVKLFKRLKWKPEWTSDPYNEAPILMRLPCHRNIIKLLAVSYDRILADQATTPPALEASKLAPLLPPSPPPRLYTSPDLVFELMNLGNLHSFSMKYLQTRNVSGNLSLPQLHLVRHICWDIFQALKHLKQYHIVHRDIKPENILLHQDSLGSITAKLSDFGLAIDLSDRKIESQRLTCKAYSAWYRAPEVFTDKDNYGHAADVWAMGMLMLELALGHSPFHSIVNDDDVCALLHFGLCFHSVSQLQHNQSPVFQQLRTKLALDPPMLDLISRTLLWHPENRITAEEAIEHACFHAIRHGRP